MWVFGVKSIYLLSYDKSESLEFRDGVVIPLLPPPRARGVTSTAIMKAAHQWQEPEDIKRNLGSPGLIITDRSRPPKQADSLYNTGKFILGYTWAKTEAH